MPRGDGKQETVTRLGLSDVLPVKRLAYARKETGGRMQRRRRWGAGLGVFAVLVVLAVPDGVDAGSGVKPVGTLERFPPEAVTAFGADLVQGDPVVGYAVNGTLLPVPEAGQLWQLYQDVEPERTGVLVRDARSLRVTGSFLLDRRIFRSTQSSLYGGEWLHAVDGGRRVFLLDRQNRLLEVDVSTFAVRDLGVLSVASSNVPGSAPLAVAGMTYDAAGRRLLVLYGGPANTSAANRVTVLQQVDPDTGERVDRLVRACTGPLPATDFSGDTYATTPLAHTDAVYVPCQQDTFAPGLGLLSSSIVVRLPRASLFDPAGDESSVLVGGPMNAALSDPGAARIVVLDWEGSVQVVDAPTMAVVGSFETSPGGSGRVGAGIDPTTGRFFFQSDAGFGYTDVRATPVSPPTVVTTAVPEGQERVVTHGNRVYVLPGHGNDKPGHYTIYKVAS